MSLPTGEEAEKLLNKIITVEMTFDQACAILGALTAGVVENDEWLKNNKDSDAYEDVTHHQRLMRTIGEAIAYELDKVREDE